MTLRTVQAPATATLQIILILSLLVYQPVNLSSCNVGTVLFGSVDALTCCMDNEKYFSLVFRRMLNNVVVVPLQNAKGDAYICAFISFVHGSARAAAIKTPPLTARAFIAALFDVTGGYLRSYLLPVTREAFYAGNVRFVEVRRLYALYDDIKDYLNTNGQGWRSPLGQYKILHYVRTLDITFSSPETSFSCDNFLLNATPRTMEGQNVTNYSVMPIPYFDDNRNPSSVALPLRYGALRSIVTPESAYIILAHYVRSIRCLRERRVSTDTFVKYNKNFRRWLLKSVLPRLGDERWYPAFGGILRVLKKTGEYTQANSYRKRDARTRRQAKRNFQMSKDSLASHNVDSFVDAVAEDLIPIDVAVLRKLMYPEMKPDAFSNTGWEISILPEIMNPNEKSDQDTKHKNEITSIENHNPHIASNILSNLDKNTNTLELEGKLTIQNHTAEFVLVPPEINEYVSTKVINTKIDTISPESVDKNRQYDVDESGNFDSRKIIIGFDSENLNQPLIKGKESDDHQIVQMRELTSTKTIQTSQSKFKNDLTIHQSETTKWTTSTLKEHLTNLIPSLTKYKHGKPPVENAMGKEPVKLNHAAVKAESPSLMSIKKEKLLKDDPSKLTFSEGSTKSTKSFHVCTTTSEIPRNTTQFAQKVFSIRTLSTKSTTKSSSQTDNGTLYELINKTLPANTSEEFSAELTVSSKENMQKSTIEQSPKPTPQTTTNSTSSENATVKLTNENATQPTTSTTAAPIPHAGVDSSIYSVLFGVGVSPQNFENLTDGCVHRTWDGIHAASPLVSHLLAGVLQSPAFNLDFLLCHVLLCLFLWLVLACASFSQGDCHFSWRGNGGGGGGGGGDGDGRSFDDTLPRHPVVEQTYYSMGGELPSSSSGRKSIFARCKDSLSTVRSVPTSYARVKESATPEEVTPLTERPTANFRQRSASLVESGQTPNRVTDNGLHRLSAGGSLTTGQVPTRCLFSMKQRFFDSDDEAESDDLSEEEIFSRDHSKFR